MNRFFLTLIVLLVLLTSVQAQSGRVRDPSITPAADSTKPTAEKAAEVPDSRTAQQLYEEANNYVNNKFAEFEKRKMPYDAMISEKIRQEQRDLAGHGSNRLHAFISRTLFETNMFACRSCQ